MLRCSLLTTHYLDTVFNELPESIAFDYTPVRQIGEGANGETWLLSHRATKDQVVLKFLKYLSATDFKAVELFQREAELLKSVNVTGVPRFYSYCTDAQGNGFLLQEFVPHPSLQSFLDEGTVFDEGEALHIALRIACILARLQDDYSPPIIHRDIKPSNVLYQRQEQAVWLIDFGSVANPQKRTGGSTIAGTFGYMPPEQMLGDVALQSDYYALGATILHLITGVFPGDMSSHGYQIDLDDILREKVPNATQGLRDLLTSLLSPNVGSRPQNAQNLCDAIQNAIVNPQKSLWDRIRLWFDNPSAKGSRSAGSGDAISVKNGEIVLHQGNYPFFTRFAEGVVRSNRFTGDHCIQFEYTFEVGGRTWCSSSIQNLSQVTAWMREFDANSVSRRGNEPAKCKVMYNRFCPSKCELHSLYLPSKNKEPHT